MPPGTPTCHRRKLEFPLQTSAAGCAAFGIVCAYIARQRTGEGQMVDTSLLDTSIALSLVESATFLAGGELLGRLARRIVAMRRMAPSVSRMAI